MIRLTSAAIIDGDADHRNDKYPAQAVKGIVGKPNSCKSIRLPVRFAIAP
ncbi:MAG: hypothetical protein WBA10_08545 [Elainellaceae cyanobacterium]